MSFADDVDGEIAAEFSRLEGCALPMCDGAWDGFHVWDPQSRAEYQREYQSQPGWAERRRAKGRASEYPAARSYWAKNKDRINAARRAKAEVAAQRGKARTA